MFSLLVYSSKNTNNRFPGIKISITQ
jgi:hypothetical protein